MVAVSLKEIQTNLSFHIFSNLVEMRTKYQKDFTKKHNIKLGFMSPFIKAAAHALQDQPIVNAGQWHFIFNVFRQDSQIPNE